jgi:hypothetical protein
MDGTQSGDAYGSYKVNLINIVGRYFWLLCLGISAYQYVVGIRALRSRDPDDPRASAEAIVLRRWFIILSDLPWVVMGWGVLVGRVPNIWYFFRPQDRNPYVVGWFATLFILAFGFAFWVFFLEGAEKVVVLQPVDFKWYRTGLRGTTRGTVELTVGRVKLFAAIGPVWIAAWTLLVWSMDAPVPK